MPLGLCRRGCITARATTVSRCELWACRKSLSNHQLSVSCRKLIPEKSPVGQSPSLWHIVLLIQRERFARSVHRLLQNLPLLNLTVRCFREASTLETPAFISRFISKPRQGMISQREIRTCRENISASLRSLPRRMIRVLGEKNCSLPPRRVVPRDKR